MSAAQTWNSAQVNAVGDESPVGEQPPLAIAPSASSEVGVELDVEPLLLPRPVVDRSGDHERFIALAATDPTDPGRGAMRDALVTSNIPLAEYLARRFRDRGEPLDDLSQVAIIGLIKAVDRFDPSRGVEFASFAAPTIIGEIKRHFRDRGWAIRVPRRLQELRMATSAATNRLNQQLGRSPTVAEIAAHLGISEEQVLDGIESGRAYATVSLDAEDDDTAALNERLGELDENLEAVEMREAVRPLLENLPERERRILVLRYFHEMTQSQIAVDIGISQMHVSRLLARSLARLREELNTPD